MKVNIITLYEGRYHYGVAALTNSLIKCGFRGDLTIYYKDAPPPWTHKLQKIEDNVFAAQDCRLHFKQLSVPRHFGYHKPFAALEELTQHPDADAVIYADPDVLFLAPWSFFEDWLGMGIALCQDFSFTFVSENHPWRKNWKGLFTRATRETPADISLYANSGFFGVVREDIDFLRLWVTLTQKFEEEGGNTMSFEQSDRYKPIVGDQDLLAVTLMGWKKKISMLGLEGMGFDNNPFILSHNIGTPKAWDKAYTLYALKGQRPTPSEVVYLRHCNFPLAPFSPIGLFGKYADLRMSQVISRLWSR